MADYNGLFQIADLDLEVKKKQLFWQKKDFNYQIKHVTILNPRKQLN